MTIESDKVTIYEFTITTTYPPTIGKPYQSDILAITYS